MSWRQRFLLTVDSASEEIFLHGCRASLSDTEMSLGDALDTGLLVVEFDESVDVGEPEVVTKTYAIHAVVDQKAKKKVPAPAENQRSWAGKVLSPFRVSRLLNAALWTPQLGLFGNCSCTFVWIAG